MLRKLMKYEFKSTARTLLPLYGVVILLAIINKLIFLLNDKVNIDETFNNVSGVFTGLSVFLYVAVLVGVMVTTLVIVVQRFRKNLLCDEGYLMNTLPVKPWENIIAKLLIAVLWGLVAIIVAAFTICILAFSEDMLQDINMMFKSISLELGGIKLINTLMDAASYLVNFIGGILLIYVSLCIGNLFSQYRIIASFVTYIIIDVITNIISTIMKLCILGTDVYATNNEISSKMTAYLGANLVLSIVFAILYYLGCEYIIRKKVNLE